MPYCLNRGCYERMLSLGETLTYLRVMMLEMGIAVTLWCVLTRLVKFTENKKGGAWPPFFCVLREWRGFI